jgi:hypothetical protein
MRRQLHGGLQMSFTWPMQTSSHSVSQQYESCSQIACTQPSHEASSAAPATHSSWHVGFIPPPPPPPQIPPQVLSASLTQVASHAVLQQ